MKECRHQFWKDRLPPYCFNCGKTEAELLEEEIERRAKAMAQNINQKKHERK